MNSTRTLLLVAAGVAISLSPACNCGQVGSADDARIAYLGVNNVVTRSLALGFAGFNAATSANIPAQNDSGAESGTVDVTGQVDQGASANKGMRLSVVLTGYSDGKIDDPKTDAKEALAITYATKAGAPLALGMSLKGIPNGTLSGTLDGAVTLDGDLTGDLTLAVTFDGTIQDDPASPGQTVRVEGSTHVTGTATSANGAFDIDDTI